MASAVHFSKMRQAIRRQKKGTKLEQRREAAERQAQAEVQVIKTKAQAAN
jgi:hypothetical protein